MRRGKMKATPTTQPEPVRPKATPGSIETRHRTWLISDIRLRADQMTLAGQHDEADLLHALLDLALVGGQAEDMRADLTEAKRDLAMAQAALRRIEALGEAAYDTAYKLPESDERDELRRLIDNMRAESAF